MPVGDASAEESTEENGLVVDGALYVDLDPEVARLHRAMLNEAIREWSIGYQVIASRVDPDDPMHMIVTEAELLEASSVLRGANPETRTLEIAAAAKVQVESARTRITQTIGELTQVVETSDPVLIAHLTGTAMPPASPAASDENDAAPDLSSLPWHAQRRVREVFGG